MNDKDFVLAEKSYLVGDSEGWAGNRVSKKGGHINLGGAAYYFFE
jgi:hypothetical protein